MKRNILVAIILLSVPFLFAEPSPKKVTLSITTAVPEYLVHGFLVDSVAASIVSEASVDDAFNQDGVNLVYAIKTNTTSNLVVSARLTPFVKLGDETSTVGIASFSIESVEKVPVSGSYQLLDLLPYTQGVRMYSYTLQVKANQDDVASASAGSYESTLSIDIASN